MKNLLSPKWLIIANTIPVLLLFFILGSDFRVIHSLLDEESIKLWQLFGGVLGGLAAINLVYSVFLIIKKKEVSVWYALFLLVTHIAYVYVYVFHIEEIMPFNVPAWMMSGNAFIYACTFLMPTLIYSLFALVVHLTVNPKAHKAWVNFLIMIAIPVLAYLFFLYVLPLWDSGYRYIDTHFYMVLFIIGTLVFLFFLLRFIYIVVSQSSRAWRKYQLLWKIPFTIIFPLLGLLANSGFFVDRTFYGMTNVFGDLSSIWFFILAFLNGVLLCLPNLDKPYYRTALFVGRSIMLAFSFYFFIVFLPYLPLSIIAIIAVGIGFLMLTPLVLFVIHISEIYRDYQYLRRIYSKAKLTTAIFAGILVIPLIMTVHFLNDKIVLNKALDYVYNPDYRKEGSKLNRKSLFSTLRNVDKQKNSRNDIFFFSYTPYISSYYNWLVLDNLTLSDEKIGQLSYIFFNEKPAYYDNDERKAVRDSVQITGTSVETRYDNEKGCWVSWVNLELTNFDTGWGMKEYNTDITLPDGCWISDYYLYMEGRKEMGILSEKKSAMWVFSQIKNEKKDPGILHYTTGNGIKFKVFPFSSDEVRETGIEFIHAEPVQINIEGNVLQLGNPEYVATYANQSSGSNGIISYVSPAEKKTLKEVNREAYFHLLVDVSENAVGENVEHLKELVNNLTTHYPEKARNAKITFVNTYIRTYSLTDNWEEEYAKQSFEGGFFVDRGIKSALFGGYKQNAYPVIIVVTSENNYLALDDNYADYKYIFPESSNFYVATKRGSAWEMRTHNLLDRPRRKISNEPVEFSGVNGVLAYPHEDGSISYVSNDSLPSIVLRKEIFDIPVADLKEKHFNTALLLQAHWWSQKLFPARADSEWVKLAQYSFDTRIMTPVTSYIAVENEAQKEALKRKQKQVLASNKDYDTIESEGSTSMSEPNLLILGLLLVCFIVWRHRRKVARRVG